MTAARTLLNLAVAATLALSGAPLWAQDGADAAVSAPSSLGGGGAERPEDRTAALLTDLARPDNAGWRRVERQLMVEWSKSGSAAFDLLLQRGREALREDDTAAAIEHLTALTDHAPDFAEGWNQRAAAYFQAGQYGPAMLDLSRAIALNPKHFGALSGMALLLAETGNKTAARAVYQEVLAIHPNLATVRDALTRLDRDLSGQRI